MAQKGGFFKGRHILIAGGTGLIGAAFRRRLAQMGASALILTRDPIKAHKSLGEGEKALSFQDISGAGAERLLGSLAGAVNLSGAGIAASRWSGAYKKEIYRSRIETTKSLVKALQKFAPHLQSFVSASSGAYYGETWERADEKAGPGQGFLAKTAQDWEREAMALRSAPVACFRLGFALSEKPGFLKNIAMLARMGFTQPLGSGNQWMSWIDIDDLSRMLCFALERSLSGPFNIASPFPVRAGEFMERLCSVLKPRLRMPFSKPLLRLAMGERAKLLAASQNLSSEKIASRGFSFQQPHLEGCLKERLKRGNKGA